MNNIILGIFIGMVVGVLGYKYVLPWLDMILELNNFKKSVDATSYQLQAQELVALFQREYPETKEVEQKESCIGFHYEQPEEQCCDDEDCEDECKRSIGFK